MLQLPRVSPTHTCKYPISSIHRVSSHLFLVPSVVTRVIKSRLQAGSAVAARYKSSLDGILTVIREEGIEGLYKGISSKLVQSVLTAAILFACQRRLYEIVKQVRWVSPCSFVERNESDCFVFKTSVMNMIFVLFFAGGYHGCTC